MKKVKLSIIVVAVGLMSLIGASLLLGPGCGSHSEVGVQQGTSVDTQMDPGLAGAPAKALFGQYYYNKVDNRIYIYDGARWVPHDSSVDAPAWQPKPAVLNAPLMQTLSSSTDGHAVHAVLFVCQTCHLAGCLLCFDPNGMAVAAGKPFPTYDSSTNTCSNIACHMVPPGTFSYYFGVDGNGDPVLNTVNVYGNPGGTTPSWYSTGIICVACHNDPPRLGTDGSNAWHSGYHGNQDPTGPYNQCQLCHPDASSPGNGIGDTITNPSLHRDGIYTVQASFKSACFFCH